MKRWNLHRISGYSAMVLAGAYSTCALLLPPFFGRKNVDFLFSTPVITSYWGGVVTLALGFIIESFEGNEEVAEQLLSREYRGLEIYENADAFVDRLADVSVGAEAIATLNFSPPAGSSAALDRYFKRLHSYISDSTSSLRHFRSLAAIEGPQKAEWIIMRSSMYLHNSRVSLGCFREQATLRLMCYHVVIKGSVGYTFFYPPVPLTGVMSACLIVNMELAHLMMGQFEIAWTKSVPVLVGGTPIDSGLEFLQGHGANNIGPDYLKLLKLASHEQYQ